MVKIMHQEETLANFAEDNQAIFKGRLGTWQKKGSKLINLKKISFLLLMVHRAV